MEILLNGVGYLIMTFADGSAKVIRTTLNKGILNEYGVSAREHHIFCLDTGNFYKLRDDAVDIDITLEKPVFENEVNEFAGKFI